MNQHYNKGVCELLYELIHKKFSNDYSLYSEDEEFIDLSNKFFQIHSYNLKNLNRRKSTIKDKIKIDNNLIDISYYIFILYNFLF